MCSSKVKAFFGLIRLKNCLIAGTATIIGFFVSTQIINTNLFLAFIATFLICGAGQAINDVFDFEIDKKNISKPITSNLITRKQATIISIILFAIGLIIALFINITTFFIAIMFVVLLIFYSALLYKKKYFGNIIVAVSTAITFIFGASATGSIPKIIFFFFATAFFASMAREITKDFEDLEKDKNFKKTLPMISKKLGKQFIIFYYFASIITAITTGIIFSLNIFYFLLVFITIIIFFFAIKFLTRNDFKNSQDFSKKGMIVSLIAFLFSIIKI